jgi:hypothetical protein
MTIKQAPPRCYWPASPPGFLLSVPAINIAARLRLRPPISQPGAGRYAGEPRGGRLALRAGVGRFHRTGKNRAFFRAKRAVPRLCWSRNLYRSLLLIGVVCTETMMASSCNFKERSCCGKTTRTLGFSRIILTVVFVRLICFQYKPSLSLMYISKHCSNMKQNQLMKRKKSFTTIMVNKPYRESTGEEHRGANRLVSICLLGKSALRGGLLVGCFD